MSLQHTWNTLQHTATHCNTLQRSQRHPRHGCYQEYEQVPLVHDSILRTSAPCPRSHHGHYPSANIHSLLISHEKVTSHINESWHVWMSHVTHGSGIFSRSRHGRYQECERVLLTELDGSKVCLSLSLCVSLCHCTHEQCMAHVSEQQGHGSFECVMLYMDELCYVRASHERVLLTELSGSKDVCVSMSARMYESLFWRMNESCHIWIRLRASAAVELGEQYSFVTHSCVTWLIHVWHDSFIYADLATIGLSHWARWYIYIYIYIYIYKYTCMYVYMYVCIYIDTYIYIYMYIYIYTYTYILIRTYIHRQVLVDCSDEFDNTHTCIHTPMYTYLFTHGLREEYVN